MVAASALVTKSCGASFAPFFPCMTPAWILTAISPSAHSETEAASVYGRSTSSAAWLGSLAFSPVSDIALDNMIIACSRVIVSSG
ncbi:hypothetical protein PAECIP111893_03682 [Paenibacillus plantiphilus]|uniref:Secreted protein n=1 Tax=Paenibacillus plantiphilus TaxID=2905650 RepID=A0ABM9CJC2_9BACL|nr:hypothetical protein PAECIP111893_03682 [Paenibacillus plantiphilus]